MFLGRVTRRLALAAVLALATLAALELGSLALLELAPGWPSRAEVQQTLAPSRPALELPEALGAAADPREQGNVLHPYLGFVRRYNPGGRNTVNGRLVDVAVNEYGFFGPSPLAERDGSFRVAITGGSVAVELYLYGREVMAEVLGAAYPGRDVEIVSLALGGMKQPQQLMALSWFLALGARFEVVVNLDGFNELALPIEQVELLGVSPLYPIRWRTLAAERVDLETASLIGRIDVLRERRERWRDFFSRPLLRHSSLAMAVWHALQTRSAAREGALESQLAARLADDAGGRDAAAGPAFAHDSRRELFASSVSLWTRASLQMWQLSRANHIDYLHFLQPSQYVTARTFTAREARRALARANAISRVAAERGYPLLRSAGAELRAQGLPFYDLTGMFEGVPDEVYRDECCHLTRRGYRLLARRLAETIAERAPRGGSRG